MKLGDNVTTDDIIPAGPEILSLRSNIPASAEHLFENIDPEFASRAKSKVGGFIVAGENYGQGSSREHAASCLMVLGIKAVLAKSFSRIHYTNLINYGIAPLVFSNAEDYSKIKQSDCLSLNGAPLFVSNKAIVELNNVTSNLRVSISHNLSERQSEILLKGGILNYTKARAIGN